MVKINKVTQVTATSNVLGGVSVKPGAMDPLISPTNSPVFEHDAAASYVKGDFVLVKKEKTYVLYEATQDNTGVFDEASWKPYTLAGKLEEQEVVFDAKLAEVDGKIDDVHTALDDRVTDVEDVLAELSDTVYQDDEGLSRVTAMPALEGVLYTDKYNPFVSLFERGIDRFKGLSLGGSTVPISTDVSIDLGPAPESGISYNLLFAEIFKVMTRTGVRMNYRLRTVSLTEDEFLESKNGSRFLVPNTLKTLASTRIKPISVLDAEVETDESLEQTSTLYKYGSYLSVADRDASTIVAQQTRLFDTEVYIAGDGSFESKTALGTVDGFMYAIPLQYIKRRNNYPYSLFNKDGGSSYVEADVKLIDTNLKPNSVFPVSLTDATVTFKEGNVYFLGAPENDVKIQYTGTMDTNNRPLFTFVDQLTAVAFGSLDQTVYSYAKGSSYYNIVTNPDVESIVKAEVGGSTSYSDLLVLEFNKLLRGELKLSSREIVEYFGPESYDTVNDTLNENHFITAEDRYRTQWSNRPAYIEIERTVSPIASENESDVELAQRVEGAFQTNDTIKFISKNIIAPPLDDTLQLSASEVLTVSGNTVTLDNVTNLSVGDNVNIVNPVTLEIVSQNLVVNEVNTTLMTIKLSNASTLKEGYLVLESSITPYFIVSADNTKASWVDINTRNPLAKLMTPNATTTLQLDENYTNTFEEMSLDFLDQSAITSFLKEEKIKEIACGYQHTVALKQDGSLWAWGNNNYGQLGDGTITNKSVPTQIGSDKTWSYISCGQYYTVALKQDGSLWAWGSNIRGQLGDGTTTQRLVPTQIGVDKTWSSTTCGFYHTVALKQDGSLWAWGYNDDGQLGDGSTTNKSVPTQIGTDKTWSSISCGDLHTVALKQDGSLWAWGWNYEGQLGNGTTTNKSVPTQIGTDKTWDSITCGFYHTVALKQDGTLWAWGWNGNGQLGDGTETDKTVPTQIGTDKTWSYISGGTGHTVALKQDGSLWAWGNNSNGQLGDGTTTNKSVPTQIGTDKTWASIACGAYHTVAIKQDGSLWAWGYNDSGQLGDGTTTNSSIPLEIIQSAVDEKGEIKVKYALGESHVVALKQDGSLWAWGNNSNGQLGDGTTTNKSVPTQIGTDKTWASIACGAYHTVAIKQDGSLWAWGYNDSGQLGDGTTTNKSVPTQIGTDKTWASIACGGYHTVALKQDGSLWAWGYNLYGQLGDGSTNKSVPTQIGSDKTWSSITCGGYHTVALKQDGSLWAWGSNDYGKLGDGSTTNKSVPTQIGTDTTWASIACGFEHTVALKQDGSLWAWGSNIRGQLGDGSTTNKSVPTQIGSDKTWSSITCGVYHTVALKQDGSLWAWGYNLYGQLGDGSTTNKSVPTQIGTETKWLNGLDCLTGNKGSTTAVMDSYGGLYFTGLNNCGQFGNGTTTNLSTLTLVMTLDVEPIVAKYNWFKEIACGDYHTVALKQDGSLWAWGSNDYGQLGDGTTTNKSVPTQIGTDTTWASIACGGYHTVALKQDGSLWAWGNNDYGQLGDGTTTNKTVPTQIGTDKTWASITCGFYHTVALKQDGTLWAWGWNGNGQLGDGSTTNKSVPTQIGSDKTWSSITCGDYHTVALKQDGSLWAWGSNDYGKLGDGSTTNKSVPTQIGTDTTWASIACGGYHTVALKQDGSLWAWGYNLYGQLGDGTTTNKTVPTQIGTDKTWASITCGFYHTVALKQDGTLWAWGWGYNDDGQLGDGSTTNKSVPTQIGSDKTWSSITCGDYHTVALKQDGSLWAWGYNNHGQLGDGTTTNKSVPTKIAEKELIDGGTSNAPVPPISKLTKFSGGGYHVMVIREDGTLWGMGYNKYGRLGNGTTVDTNNFVQIGTDKNWASVSANGNQTVALKQDGSLWAWGRNDEGQLGDGTTVDKLVPTQIGTDKTWSYISGGTGHTIAIKQDGSLWVWGRNDRGQLGDGTETNRTVPTQIGSDKTWASVAGGFGHTVALKQDGSLWAWGYNGNGQLGDGTETNRTVPTQIGTDTTWASISCGGNHTVALKQDGSLWAWGRNVYGQLGDGTTTNKSVPTQIGTETNWSSVACKDEHTVCLKQDGSLWAWGNNDRGQLGDGTTSDKLVPNKINFNIPIRTIMTLTDHLFFVTNDIDIYHTGLSDIKTSTVGTNALHVYPVLIQSYRKIISGLHHTVAIKQDGSLWAWGYNGNGQLGDGTTTNKSVPTQIGSDKTWSSIACGVYHTVAIKQDGSLWAWGNNSNGQLGDGTETNRTVPTQIGTDKTWASIACGFEHTVALKQDGSLWAWGYNSNGQLGDGTTVNKSVPTQIGSDKTWSSIACGVYHTVALKQDGSLWAWGNNSNGQLGDGTETNRTVPTQIGSDKTWSSIACGFEHTVALKQDGSLWAWGNNSNGQLGDGTETNRTVPTQIGTDKTWASIACGFEHTVALKQDGSLWAWGYNSNGQLGDGTTVNKSVPTQIGTDTTWASIACGGNHTVALKQDGSLWAWGSNDYGQLGDGTDMNKLAPFRTQTLTDKSYNKYSKSYPIQNGYITVNELTAEVLITSKANSTRLSGLTENLENRTIQGLYSVGKICDNGSSILIKSASGSVFTSGSNTYAQLLTGNTTTKTDITVVPDVTVKDIALGTNFTVLIKPDGTLWSVGLNDKGQLGQADTTNRTTLAQIGLDDDWKSVEAGASTVIALKEDGTVYEWGLLQDKSNGATADVIVNIPTKVSTLSGVKEIRSGLNHRATITNEGVFIWGRNIQGELCDDTTKSVFTPIEVKLPGVLEIKDIQLGNNFTLILTKEGQIYGAGDNSNGQLLVNYTTSIPKLTRVKLSRRAERTIKVVGTTVYVYLNDSFNNSTVTGGLITTPITIGKMGTVKQFLASTQKCVLLTDGSLWAWGRNDYGQLGDGTTTNKSVPTQIGTDKTWSSLACGVYHTVALKQDGSLWAWGYNNHGQLGDGTTTNKSVPTQIGSDKTWSSITCGGYHTVALKQDGSLWAWGSNLYGQLGDGSTTNKSVPTQIGSDKTWSSITCGGYHTVALKQDGSLWAWGSNLYGQLGDGSTTNKSVPTQIGSDKTWSSITCGGYHTVALKQDGSLWAWGYNNHGQLGDGTTTNKSVPTQIGSDKTWSSITCGGYHTVALKQDGSLWAWGKNDRGQLGDGTETSKSTPTSIDINGQDIVKIFSSMSSSMSILTSNNNNILSTIGTVYNNQSYENHFVKTSLDTFNKLSYQKGFTLGLKEGIVYSWGLNANGQLAQGTTGVNNITPTKISEELFTDIAAGVTSSLFIKEDGTLWVAGSMNSNKTELKKVGTDANWSKVFTRNGFIVLVKTDGTLWEWYEDLSVALPTQVGTATNWSTNVAIGTDHTIILKTDNTLWGWGTNAKGELGVTIGEITTPVQLGTATNWNKIGSGYQKSYAVNTENELYGLGAPQIIGTVTTPTKITLDFKVLNVWSYGNSTFLQSSKREIYAIGDNTNGKLGVNDNLTDLAKVLEFGSEIFVGDEGTIINTGVGYVVAGSSEYGQLGNISSYVTSSTSTTTFKYRELLPPAEGINSAIKDGGNLSTVNGIQYQKDNYSITFAFPVNKLQVSVDGTTYEKINQANLPTAKFVKLNAEEEIANMMKTTDVSLLKAVLNVNGTEIKTTTTGSLNVVFPVNDITLGSRISVSVEVELGNSFAPKEGESVYAPTQVRVNDTNRDTLNTVSQNILPELTKYSPYVSVPTFTDKGSSVSFAGDASVSATVYLDTSLTYTLEGASANTKVEISSEDSSLIFTLSMTTASTKVNLLKSSTDTVKGYKKVTIKFSAVDTTKAFEFVKSLGLYNSFQKAVSPMPHYANEVEVVFDGTKHQVQTVNNDKVRSTIDGYDASTKTAKVTISENVRGMGLKLNLIDSVGDLTAHQLNEQLDTLAINATITVGTTNKAYTLKVKDYVSGNYHELTKVGSTFILNVNAASSAQYVDGDGALTVLVESDTGVTGDEIKVTFDDIKIFTDASDIDIETRFLPIIYLNSNGDIRTQTGLFNQFGKASEMRFVVHETIKLQPVKDLTGITVIQEADDILITDVVSTNVGLVDHPFKNPLGLFDGIVTDNLVGVVGFKEARFEADSKFTNLSSNFKIVDGQLVGLSSQDTELVLSSPVIGLTKALVNTSDGLAIMITAIPTSNGKFDTFAAENTRYIIPLNTTLSSPIETFDYQTIHKG